jgi:hypothetical protein
MREGRNVSPLTYDRRRLCGHDVVSLYTRLPVELATGRSRVETKGTPLPPRQGRHKTFAVGHL